MAETKKELMSIDEFLDIYSIGRSAYFNLVKKGKLKITKLGSRTFIKRIDAEIWMSKIGEEV